MEAFYTLQGEGAHTGCAAYFIRLGGCDVGCHWCDVKESWNAEDHPSLTLEEIVQKAALSGVKMAVITGGEPLMYDMNPLTLALQDKGIHTHVETSGAHPLTGKWDWLCFSPKKFKAPHEAYYREANELKVVIYHKRDFEWAEEHAFKMHRAAQLFLQPEWSKEKEMLPLIFEYIKQHPKWRISLQTHKYMNIP